MHIFLKQLALLGEIPLAPPHPFLSNYFTEAKSHVSFLEVSLVNSISRSSVYAAGDETQDLTPARQVFYHKIQALC